MPGFPVLHHLPEFVQTHIHWVGDAVPSSCPVTSFSSCPQSFPAPGSFPMSWLLASGGQSIEALASACVIPMNTQGWFPLGRTGLTSLQSKGLSSVFSSTTSSNVSILWHSGFFIVPLSHSYMTTGKTIVLTIQTFIGKVGGEDSGSIRGRGKDWRLQAHWGLLWNTGDVLVLFFTIIILILGFFKVEVSLNYSIVLVVFWLLICVVVALAC